MSYQGKKNCSNCHSRLFPLAKVCECGCSYFISDTLVVSKYYREGMKGADLVRELKSKGFSLSQPIILARMKDLGFKNEKQMQQDKQADLKEYLKTVSVRPSGRAMSKKFGMKEKTAYSIISAHFGNVTARVTKKFNNSEQLLIDEYLNTYNKFLALPKSEQTIWRRNSIVCEINTLKKYRLI